jgi:hypothetical protein
VPLEPAVRGGARPGQRRGHLQAQRRALLLGALGLQELTLALAASNLRV